MTENRWVRTPGEPRAAAGGELPPITSLDVVYLSDPDAVAMVIPPPLAPAPEPRVHLRFTDIDLDFGSYKWQERVGYFGVDVLYEGQPGEYPLLIPIDKERAVAISRERFGEPKKLADIEIDRDGNEVHASMTRQGVTFAEVSGTVTGDAPVPAPYDARQFWFKFLPAVSGRGFDCGPLLVQVDQVRTMLTVEAIEGKVELRDLASAPLVDLPVQRLVSIQWTTRRATHHPKVVGPVDADAFEPFAMARYDT